MSILEGQAPVPPEDKGVRKVFYVTARPVEGPIDILRTDGLPGVWDKWTPHDPRFPTTDVVEPVCQSVDITRLDETRWEVVAHYAYA